MAQLNPRIVAKLKQIPDVAVNAARQAMEEGAEEVCEYIRTLVRATFKTDSGDMIRSIGWTWGELPPGTFMIDEIRSGKNQGEQYATLRIRIYAGAGDGFYFRFHEFGTEHGLPARPTFYPAWKAKRAEFRKKIRDRVRDAIRKEFRNG